MRSALASSTITALVLGTPINAAIIPRQDSSGNSAPTSYYSGRGSDPVFTISPRQLQSVVSCVGGIQNARNPVLLVPGTYCDASLVYNPGWLPFLGGLGYDVCYVSPPSYMAGDIQDTLEYIVNAIHNIYDASGSPVIALGHSQGGLAIQSALTYYPSIRNEVSQYISLAGDVRGSTRFAVPQADLANTSAVPSLWQQSNASNWVLTLQQKGGWYNWVPTTTLFSTADGSVTPQINSSFQGSATYTGGSYAGNILVQDACPDLAISHIDFLGTNFAFQVVRLALESDKKYVDISEVQTAVSSGQIDCSIYFAPSLNVALYSTNLGINNGISGGQAIAPVLTEPLLRPYVDSTVNNEIHDT